MIGAAAGSSSLVSDLLSQVGSALGVLGDPGSRSGPVWLLPLVGLGMVAVLLRRPARHP